MVGRICLEIVGVVGIRGADYGDDVALVPHERGIHAVEAASPDALLLDVIAARELHYVAVCLAVYAAVHQHPVENRGGGAHHHQAVVVVQGDIGIGIVAHVLYEPQHVVAAQVCR